MTMSRQSPRRNQRSTRFNLMHAFQIFMCLAICIWLLYQVRHFYVNNKAYVQRLAKVSETVRTSEENLNLGRKDLDIGRQGMTGIEMGTIVGSKLEESDASRKGRADNELEENSPNGNEKEEDEDDDDESEGVEDLIDEEDREIEEENEQHVTEKKEFVRARRSLNQESRT